MVDLPRYDVPARPKLLHVIAYGPTRVLGEVKVLLREAVFDRGHDALGRGQRLVLGAKHVAHLMGERHWVKLRAELFAIRGRSLAGLEIAAPQQDGDTYVPCMVKCPIHIREADGVARRIGSTIEGPTRGEQLVHAYDRVALLRSNITLIILSFLAHSVHEIVKVIQSVLNSI